MNKFLIEHLTLNYSDGTESLKDISLGIPANAITVLFGPAGGGKSTLLRVLNRLNDLADVKLVSGRVLLYSTSKEAENHDDDEHDRDHSHHEHDDDDHENDGDRHPNDQPDYINVLDPKTDVIALRRRVGMVFARPVVLPLTIRGNLTYSLELMGERSKDHLDEAVERSLKKAALWDEVKDRLDDPAVAISGGQQQRLCLARSLVLEPEVILLDEPTSGLDPISTGKVEASLNELKQNYTIVLVPHSIQQAARVADHAAFFLQGELVEFAPGKRIFTHPQVKRTEDYVEGRFG